MEGLRSLEYSKRLEKAEGDPYSMAIVQDLLQGTSEWINIQDIVKLTFKSLFDVVKAQGETIKDLERLLPTKASKAEMNSGLSQKANISDVSKAVADISSSIEAKIALDDVQVLLEDKVTRRDLQYAVGNKVGLDELRVALERKVSLDEYRAESSKLAARLDDLQRECLMRIASSASVKDIEEVRVLLEQKASIIEMNENLQTKACKDSVANALKRKANVTDLASSLATKADVSDVEKLVEVINSKVQMADFDAVKKEIAAKAVQIEAIEKEVHQKSSIENVSILNSKVVEIEKKEESKYKEMKAEISKKANHDAIEKEIAKLQAESKERLNKVTSKIEAAWEKLEDINAQLGRKSQEIVKIQGTTESATEESKKSLELFHKSIETTSNQIRLEIQEEQLKVKKSLLEIQKSIEELDSSKSNRKELSELQTSFAELLEPKADLTDVQKAITEFQTNVAERIVELKNETSNEISSGQKSIQSLLDAKANHSEMMNLLSKKVDQSAASHDLKSKVDIKEIEEIKGAIRNLESETGKKVDANVLEDQITITKSQVEEVIKDMSLKANIKDVCTLIDAKTNLEDFQKAMVEMQKEITKKANHEDLTNALADQGVINETLCAENCLGRWLWKSGELKNGYAVQWEVQSVNTCPDNFLWEKDRITIMTVAPGLYEITMGFFTKKKPTVQLLINGEAIVSAVNSASYVIHHSSGKMKSTGKHSSGNITGLTMIDFIALQPRAKISVSYTGDPEVEGFLGLRKL